MLLVPILLLNVLGCKAQPEQLTVLPQLDREKLLVHKFNKAAVLLRDVNVYRSEQKMVETTPTSIKGGLSSVLGTIKMSSTLKSMESTSQATIVSTINSKTLTLTTSMTSMKVSFNNTSDDSVLPSSSTIPKTSLHTTLLPPRAQPSRSPTVPTVAYLKYCFYAEEELCLYWYNTNTDSANATYAQPNMPATAISEGTESNANNRNSYDNDNSNNKSNNHNNYANHNNYYYEDNNNNNNNHNNNNNNNSKNNNIQRDINSCQCRPHPIKANSWYCCNITHISMISSCSHVRNWTNLHIRNLTMPQMDISNSIYRSLQSLAITDGNISKLINVFPRHSNMKCLNITNNNINEIQSRAVKDAPHLEFLGIAKNNLSRVPNWNQNKNITMDISGNMRMLCEPLNEAIYSDSFKFVNPEQSFCLYNATHQWFNSTDFVSIKQLERTKQCRTKCPVIPNFGNCTCYHDQIMIIQGDQSKPICHVDCSNLGLLELPSKLPDNTFTLNITNNKIKSLGDHFHTNPTYHNIVKLIADNNEISSIYEFEGTKFIEHFQRIYMRNNSLSKIPEYFLNNALMDTDIGRRIYLAGNKLQCDCNSAKTLQNWLKERSSDIPDYMEIRCRNLPQSVIELQETKLCQAPPDWTDYIYYLITIEILLLIALITKVSYDYWVFKTAGYLPWPASKMPKLPCDWLCES